MVHKKLQQLVVFLLPACLFEFPHDQRDRQLDGIKFPAAFLIIMPDNLTAVSQIFILFPEAVNFRKKGRSPGSIVEPFETVIHSCVVTGLSSLHIYQFPFHIGEIFLQALLQLRLASSFFALKEASHENAHSDPLPAAVEIIFRSVNLPLFLVVVDEISALQHSFFFILLVLCNKMAALFCQAVNLFLHEQTTARMYLIRCDLEDFFTGLCCGESISVNAILLGQSLSIYGYLFRLESRTDREHAFLSGKQHIAICPDIHEMRIVLPCFFEEILFSLMRENHPADDLLLPGLQLHAFGMQIKTAAVIALAEKIPPDAVGREASLRHYHAKMGRFPSHPESADPTHILSAEKMGVAASDKAGLAVLILIRHRKGNLDIFYICKIRLFPFIFDPDLRPDHIALPDTGACRGELLRHAHLPIGKIRPDPVHFVGVVFEYQFFHHLYSFTPPRVIPLTKYFCKNG